MLLQRLFEVVRGYSGKAEDLKLNGMRTCRADDLSDMRGRHLEEIDVVGGIIWRWAPFSLC